MELKNVFGDNRIENSETHINKLVSIIALGEPIDIKDMVLASDASSLLTEYGKKKEGNIIGCKSLDLYHKMNGIGTHPYIISDNDYVSVMQRTFSNTLLSALLRLVPRKGKYYSQDIRLISIIVIENRDKVFCLSNEIMLEIVRYFKINCSKFFMQEFDEYFKIDDSGYISEYTLKEMKAECNDNKLLEEKFIPKMIFMQTSDDESKLIDLVMCINSDGKSLFDDFRARKKSVNSLLLLANSKGGIND